MVVDTAYYDALQVPATASELDIKKAYRKLAIKLHPDKNPGDEEANQRFQAIGEAYQVLSDPQLRAAYDKYGKDNAVPGGGFEDPSEMFAAIFGGEAFQDWIGEISLMKDLNHQVEITSKNEAEDLEAEEKSKIDVQNASTKDGVPAATPPVGSAGTAFAPDEKTARVPRGSSSKSATPIPPAHSADGPSISAASSSTTLPTNTYAASTANPYSQDRPKGIPTRLALMERSEEEARQTTAGVSQEEKDLRAKERKKGGLSREQREELMAYEQERKRVRDERVATLAKKLTDRVSVWTETDRGADVTRSFRAKTQLEVENLKMESFGLEILHAIGYTYMTKAASLLKSQKFLGIGGFFSRLKDKGALAKDMWGAMGTALEAQASMEEMARAEERGGEDWSEEKRAEHEKKVTGKILAAAWRGSKFEIQSVLRDVCDKVLGDKGVSLQKRLVRAEALAMIGEIFAQAKRSPDEEVDHLVFEQLVADAQKKKEKEEKKEEKKDEKKPKRHSTMFHHEKDKTSNTRTPSTT